jgi:DNA repair exonuclease SbcCD ATPase subunit
MLEKFTKKDKRTNLKKEIDSVLEVMDKMKAEIDETNSEELDNRISSLISDMSEVDSGSEDYLNMAKALEFLYKAKANVKDKLEQYSEMVENFEKLNKAMDSKKERNATINRILITGGITLAEVVIMLYFEETRVITSKVFSRLPKVHV